MIFTILGNPVYEEAAMRAMRALWHFKSNIGLVGNHVDVSNGKWTATDAGIGNKIFFNSQMDLNP